MEIQNSRGKNGCAASPSSATLPLVHVERNSMSSSFHTFRVAGSANRRRDKTLASKFSKTFNSCSTEPDLFHSTQVVSACISEVNFHVPTIDGSLRFFLGVDAYEV